MLDRYIQDTSDNAHESSAEASDIASGTDSDDDASEASSASQDRSDQDRLDQEQVHTDMGRLVISGEAEQHVSAHQANLHQQNGDADSQADNSQPNANADSKLPQRLQSQTAQQQKSDDHVPDQVLIRGKRSSPQGEAAAEAAASEADDASTMSHISQRPGQAAVQQRVLDQHRSRLRKQVLARATRNAQKSGSKKDRKQAAGQVDW